MELTTWNPFRELDQLFSRHARPGSALLGDSGWIPAVDISESDKEYLIKAELAGLSQDDITLSVDNGVLSLSGERSLNRDDKSEKQHRIERAYGRFERSFSLPENVVAEKISAECKEGVLQVHLPKTEISSSGPKKIAIQ